MRLEKYMKSYAKNQIQETSRIMSIMAEDKALYWREWKQLLRHALHL